MKNLLGTSILLVELGQAGIRLTRVGDRIRYAPASAMTPRLLVRLQEHKSDLLELLRVAESPGPSWAATEIERFFSVCVPDPYGHGWHDPGADRRLLEWIWSFDR